MTQYVTTTIESTKPTVEHTEHTQVQSPYVPIVNGKGEIEKIIVLKPDTQKGQHMKPRYKYNWISHEWIEDTGRTGWDDFCDDIGLLEVGAISIFFLLWGITMYSLPSLYRFLAG